MCRGHYANLTDVSLLRKDVILLASLSGEEVAQGL